MERSPQPHFKSPIETFAPCEERFGRWLPVATALRYMKTRQFASPAAPTKWRAQTAVSELRPKKGTSP